jgi:hypothetical protein
MGVFYLEFRLRIAIALHGLPDSIDLGRRFLPFDPVRFNVVKQLYKLIIRHG